MNNQLVLEFLESANDILEGGRNIHEVGDTATDDENFTLGIGRTPGNEIN
jgi:hypothetical protein